MRLLILCCTALLCLAAPRAFGQSVNFVTTTADNVAGSFRTVVNNSFPGDTVRFQVTGTIVLSTGSIAYSKDLVIDGPGMDSLTISANGNSQIFQITGGTTSLSNLSLAQGSTNNIGGGIHMQGDSLSLHHVRVESCSAVFQAGGIFATCPLVIEGCEFNNNQCTNTGGAASAAAISCGWHTHISNSTFTNNQAAGTNNSGGAASYGGAIYMNPANLTIDSCTFTGNSISSTAPGSLAQGHGGAVYHQGWGHLVCTNSTFSNNQATGNGGNLSSNASQGGAIGVLATAASARIENCTFTDNLSLIHI